MPNRIGGSKGGRQGRAPPPWGPNSFIFMQFSAKIINKHTHFGSWRPPPGENPRSATESSYLIGLEPLFHLKFWEVFSYEMQNIISHELSSHPQKLNVKHGNFGWEWVTFFGVRWQNILGVGWQRFFWGGRWLAKIFLMVEVANKL